MRESDNAPDDPVEAMLDTGGRQHADDDLRSAVLAQTPGRHPPPSPTAAMRHGRQPAGLLPGRNCDDGRVADRRKGCARRRGQSHFRRDENREQVPAPRTRPAPEKHEIATATPSGFESWRRIGDHYLRDTGDVALAVSGYTEALNLASEKELAISPAHDNWLLMALKDARMKEKRHAYSQQN